MKNITLITTALLALTSTSVFANSGQTLGPELTSRFVASHDVQQEKPQASAKPAQTRDEYLKTLSVR